MEEFKIVNYKDTKDLIKMFCRGDIEDKKKFWIDSIAQSIKFQYDNYTTEMINDYNDLIEYFNANLPDMEINKASRETLEKVLESVLSERKDLKDKFINNRKVLEEKSSYTRSMEDLQIVLNKLDNEDKKSTYTATQKKAIKKYRQSEKGKEKNNELSKKYYEERKDIPEIKEKVKQAHKTSYSKLKEDPERYKLYLERKKELYKLRKERHNELVEISLDEMIDEQNIINPIIN